MLPPDLLWDEGYFKEVTGVDDPASVQHGLTSVKEAITNEYRNPKLWQVQYSH